MKIRKISKQDRQQYLEMTKMFYHSEAVLHPVPIEHAQRTFEEMMRSEVYLRGYFLEVHSKVAGYALTARTFSQESGGIVVWLEELFILPEYRSQGLGRECLSFLENEEGISRIRLEVEPENKRAFDLYCRLGYRELPYLQLVKDFT
jgi:ribosomal protein S18 acetylase RimI-like enzyme